MIMHVCMSTMHMHNTISFKNTSKKLKYIQFKTHKPNLDGLISTRYPPPYNSVRHKNRDKYKQNKHDNL